jgi:hypothetical protein
MFKQMMITSDFVLTGSTQRNGINKVASRGYMVGSINEDGVFSFAKDPVIHSTSQLALVEVNRLAAQNPGTAYFHVQCLTGKMLPKMVSSVTF